MICISHVPIVLKSGSLNLVEPSEPVQACNGIALPLPYHAGSKTRAVIWSGKLLYKWLALDDKAMNLQCGQEAGKFITGPCKRTLFHRVTKLIKTQSAAFLLRNYSFPPQCK
jgi:hypothetical protein